MQTLKAFLFIAMAMVMTSYTQAQTFNYKKDGPFAVSKSFRVNGTCEMCKHRIESSIKNLPGIWSTYWDISSRTLMVNYDRTKVTPAMIEKLVSAEGHDIDSINASPEAYSKLPDCCHYQRKS